MGLLLSRRCTARPSPTPPEDADDILTGPAARYRRARGDTGGDSEAVILLPPLLAPRSREEVGRGGGGGLDAARSAATCRMRASSCCVIWGMAGR